MLPRQIAGEGRESLLIGTTSDLRLNERPPGCELPGDDFVVIRLWGLMIDVGTCPGVDSRMVDL